MVDTDKLRAAFPDTTVFKDPNIVAIFKSGVDSVVSAGLDSEAQDGVRRQNPRCRGIAQIYLRNHPAPENLLELKDAARSEGRTKKFLAKIEIQFSVRCDEYTFAIPELVWDTWRR